MVKICVVQADNRPSLNYLLLTQRVNEIFCRYLGYDYLFLEIQNHEHGDIHPATKKIHVVHKFLETSTYDILVFLDSDAWIQIGRLLNDIINNLINDNTKHGCFSRDPYVEKNTFINSGSFILKINDFNREMYRNIINDLNNNSNYHNCWPYDQYYISKHIFEMKENFNIFVPDILNTPFGKVLRHNWLKNQRMYIDLENLINDEDIMRLQEQFEFHKYIDREPFPNTIVHGYEYSD